MFWKGRKILNSDRNSSIEFLKVVGMVLIVVFHSYTTIITKSNGFFPELIYAIDLSSLHRSITKSIFLIIAYFGVIGDLIFMICPSWFLCESKKPRLSKTLMLIIVTFSVSVIYILVIHYLYPDININGQIRRCLFPLSYGNNWYITCYLVIYIIHGYLNLIIGQMNRASHLLAVSSLFFIYSVLTLYGKTKFYYPTPLTTFIMIYFLTSYVKKYKSGKQNGILFALIGIIGFVFMDVLKRRGIPAYIADQGFLYWAKMTNPFLILFIVGLMIIITEHNFHSRVINYISSLSLILYLIHENILFRSIVRPIIWKDICMMKPGASLLSHFILFAFVILCIGFGMSLLFKLICMPWIIKLSKIADDKLNRLWKIVCKRNLA